MESLIFIELNPGHGEAWASEIAWGNLHVPGGLRPGRRPRMQGQRLPSFWDADFLGAGEGTLSFWGVRDKGREHGVDKGCEVRPGAGSMTTQRMPWVSFLISSPSSSRSGPRSLYGN